MTVAHRRAGRQVEQLITETISDTIVRHGHLAVFVLMVAGKGRRPGRAQLGANRTAEALPWFVDWPLLIATHRRCERRSAGATREEPS